MQQAFEKTMMGDSSSPKSNVISKTKISTIVSGSPKGQMKRHNVLNFQQDHFDMEIKLASVDKCLVQVEIQEQGDDYVDDGDDCAEPTAAAESPPSNLREESKSRLRRLGKLYCSVESGGDAEISSPIHHRSEEAVVGSSRSQISHKGRSKLAALAHNINLWENESPLPLPMQTAASSSTTRITKIKQQQGNTPSKTSSSALSSVIHKRHNEKSTLELNNSVVDALECQGYTREGADENKLLTYQFKEDKMTALNKDERDIEGLNKMAKHNRDVVTCKKFVPSIRLIEEEMRTPRGRPSIHSFPKDKDPSALSLHERKAIFERNVDKTLLLPKAPIALSCPVSAALKKTSKPIDGSIEDGRMENDFNWGNTVGRGGEKKSKDYADGGGIVSHRLMTLRNKKDNLDDYSVTISQQQIEHKIREERQRDMDVLMNRFHKPCNNSGNNNYAYAENKLEAQTDDQILQAGTQKSQLRSPRKTTSHNNLLSASGCSAQVQSVLEDVREIRVRRNHSHSQRRLYPVLSDLETATETEETEVAEELIDDDVTTSEDDNASSLELSLSASSSTDREDSENCGPTPPKCGKVLFKSPVTHHHYHHQQQQQQPSEIAVAGVSAARTTRQQAIEDQFTPTHVVDGDEVIPLQHTVSFYRKHQQQHYKVSQNVFIDSKQQQQQRAEALDSIRDEELAAVDSKKQLLLEKINSLHAEVLKQERTVAQSSQALNLCNARLEFNGSTEQVEAERLLLIGAHRRQAALYEIGKLQVALMQDDHDAGGQQHEQAMIGDLIIGRLTLPLKREYVRALGAAGGNGHHVVCLIKCEDAKQQVLATKVVSTTANSEQTTVEGVVDISNWLELNSIKPQSTVTVEIYCLQAYDQHLPHHIKYHIKDGKHTTPRKLQLLMRTGKEEGDKMTRIPIESPGGGGRNTTRSSSFALMGYAIFAVRSLVDNTPNGRHPPFTLNQTPQMSPLEGSVQLSQILCKWTMPAVERRGFLTMFEDVSGFGAWHRRWFRLDGNVASLQYWRYPDDELERDGKVIELKRCRSGVGLVPREVCARLHTILLLEEGNDSAAKRYLLSADTKEERIAWCHDINRVIVAMQSM